MWVGIGTDCNIKVYPVRAQADGTIMLANDTVTGAMAAG